MIRINLLPHREEKRRARQRQFALLIGVAAGAALIVGGFIWSVFEGQLEFQKSRNKYLDGEIAKVEKDIEEIKKIREETAALLAKKQVVESLQSNRSEPVHLLDELLRQLPEGLYLKSVKQTGTKVNVTGYAQSSARVATFMRNIEGSAYLEKPVLSEIVAKTVNNQRANEFNLDLQVKRAKPEIDKGDARKGANAKSAEKKP